MISRNNYLKCILKCIFILNRSRMREHDVQLCYIEIILPGCISKPINT
uniref:Uncharacterized protein n=1 Tax=Macaca fascicularis TaxID=9541 RepID=A0A7N9CU15_MACFA